MANRAEVTKVNSYITIGQADCVSVPKVVAYLIMEPGTSEPDTSNKQAHGHQQVIRRG